MDKIKKFLEENGYDYYLCENGNEIYAEDDFLNILIIENDGNYNFKSKYLLRIADLKYFDRWANSGDEWQYNTEEEVLKHLKNRVEILTNSIQEYIYDIVEKCEWENDYSNVKKLIEILDEMVYE